MKIVEISVSLFSSYLNSLGTCIYEQEQAYLLNPRWSVFDLLLLLKNLQTTEKLLNNFKWFLQPA